MGHDNRQHALAPMRLMCDDARPSKSFLLAAGMQYYGTQSSMVILCALGSTLAPYTYDF